MKAIVADLIKASSCISQYIIFLLLFLAMLSYNQIYCDKDLDSLENLVLIEKTDSSKALLLSKLSYKYANINPKKGVILGKQGLEISERRKWTKGLSDNYNSLAVNYQKVSNFDSAEYFLNKALEINRKLDNQLGIARNLANLANIYKSQSNYSVSIDFYYKALTIFQSLESNIDISNIYLNIGGIYMLQSDFSKSLEILKKALEVNSLTNDQLGRINIISNIGIIYAEIKDYENALANFLEVLEIDLQLGFKVSLAEDYLNIGILYEHLNQFGKAYEYYQQSLIFSRELELKRIESTAYANIAELFFKQSIDSGNNLDSSIYYNTKALRGIEELGDVQKQSVILGNLARAYELNKDFKEAFYSFQKYSKLRDSIFSIEKQKEIATIEAKRELEVKEIEITLLEVQQEKQQFQVYLMILGIIALVIFITLLLRQRHLSELLLLNVLPKKIALRLKAKEHPIADYYENASILFVDIAGFTKIASVSNPKHIVSLLNELFTAFDRLAVKHNVEKIKTIGDSYMAVAGVPEIAEDHAKRAALLAIDIRDYMLNHSQVNGNKIQCRIGIDCGAVVAGVIGEKKFVYDLWSDAVNTASRMESTSELDMIQISENFKLELESKYKEFDFSKSRQIEIKGKGLMKTYYLDRKSE